MFGVTDARGAAAVRTYVKLLRASRSVSARVHRYLSACELTVVQLGVLEAVLHLGPLTQRDLGRKLLTSPANMTDVIDKLQHRGHVVRDRCGADRRQVYIMLTPEGRALIETVFPRHAADIGEAFAGLSDSELETLENLLRRLGQTAGGPTPCAGSDPDAG